MSSTSSSEDYIQLPAFGCLELREHPERGRGVFTCKEILQGTLIHISPVLVFDRQEYNTHGKYTRLDHYTYCWKNGSYALALGLGSMFNHEPFGHQNVGFTRDMSQNVIKYTALRDISAGEELCICYGPNVWFDMVSGNQQSGCGNKNDPDADNDDDMPSAEDFLRGIDIA